MNKGEAIARDTSLMTLAFVIFYTALNLIQIGDIVEGVVLFCFGFGILAAKYHWRINGVK